MDKIKNLKDTFFMVLPYTRLETEYSKSDQWRVKIIGTKKDDRLSNRLKEVEKQRLRGK